MILHEKVSRKYGINFFYLRLVFYVYFVFEKIEFENLSSTYMYLNLVNSGLERRLVYV